MTQSPRSIVVEPDPSAADATGPASVLEKSVVDRPAQDTRFSAVDWRCAVGELRAGAFEAADADEYVSEAGGEVGVGIGFLCDAAGGQCTGSYPHFASAGVYI